MSWRVEKCIRTQGSVWGESLVLCPPRKTLQVQLGVTVTVVLLHLSRISSEILDVFLYASVKENGILGSFLGR